MHRTLVLVVSCCWLLATSCGPQTEDDELVQAGRTLVSNSTGCKCDPATEVCEAVFEDNGGVGCGNRVCGFTVPAGCTTLLIKAWAAGGSTGVTDTHYIFGKAGGGGYAAVIASVTPKEELIVQVGDANGFGSAVWRPQWAGALLIAGGGGNNHHLLNSAGYTGTPGTAGAGGGFFGQDATNAKLVFRSGTTTTTWSLSGGQGGSQTAGGAGGVGLAGTVADVGGKGSDPVLPSIATGGYGAYLNWGGFGLAGGGGGATGNGIVSPGGGGSGYVDPASPTWSNQRGNLSVAANPQDHDRVRTSPCPAGQVAPHCQLAGEGGLPVAGQDQGTPGRIVIRWGMDANQSDFPIDPNAPHVAFSAASTTVSEAGPTVTLTVTRVSGDSSPFDVSYATANDTALAGSDYTATSGTLSFAKGVNSRTFTVPILNDTVVEGAEAFSVRLSNPTLGAVLDTISAATVNITDNDLGGTIAFKAATASIKEGAVPSAVTLTLSRTSGTASGASVDYATHSGTATEGADFVSSTGTVTFAAGATTASFTVPVLDDAVAEGDETFSVTLSNPRGGATVGALATAMVTIKDSENAFTFSAPSYKVTEGTASVVLTVLRTGATTTAASVKYATVDGSAVAGADYTAKTGTLSFAANVVSATISIAVLNDTVHESGESFSVALSAPAAGWALGDVATAAVQVADNDLGGVLAFSAAAYTATEGNTGTTLVKITVTRTSGLASAVTVGWATADGTAVAGSDYVAASGTLSFAASATSASFTVAVIGDTVHELAETVQLSLSNPTGGASLGGINTAVLTIKDND